MPPAPGRAGQPPRRSPDGTWQHLHDVVAPLVAAAGLDLDDVAVSTVGRRQLVRVVIDADGGIDLDAIAEISRDISAALDAEVPGAPAFAGSYVLEVTSPGVDRPLTEVRHWRRACGRLVEVAVGEDRLTGRVVDVDDDGVRLDLGDATRYVRWGDLGTGKVRVEFTRPGEAE